MEGSISTPGRSLTNGREEHACTRIVLLNQLRSPMGVAAPLLTAGLPLTLTPNFYKPYSPRYGAATASSPGAH